MPQLDPAVFEPQIVWLFISFALLYWLMKTRAAPKISEILEEREHKINDSLRKADLLRDDAEAKMGEYERTMAEARSRAQETLRAVRERVAADAARQHAELSERLQREINAAEQRINAARDDALGNLHEMAVEIAGAAAGRLLGTEIAGAPVSAAVDRAMGETR